MSIMTRHIRKKPEPDLEGEGGDGDGGDTVFVSDWVGGAPLKKKKQQKKKPVQSMRM